MYKKYLLLAGISGFLAVLLGAFGAHGLTGTISQEHLGYWKTANEYHFYHTLATLVMVLATGKENKFVRYSANCFLIGIVLFSGSLYLMAINQILNINVSVLGPVTPLGGLFFLCGWACLIIAALKNKDA